MYISVFFKKTNVGYGVLTIDRKVVSPHWERLKA